MKNISPNDPTWKLLSNASKQEAGPMFSRNVMRSIRLENQQPASWWNQLLKPLPIFITSATAATLALLITLIIPSQVDTESLLTQSSPDESFAEISAVFSANDDLDIVISPISLLATSDLDELHNLELDLDLFLDL